MNHTGPLTGRVALVTGALGRLGRVWCRALADSGAIVAAVDLEGVEVATEFEALLATHAGSLHVFRADVTDAASLEALRGQLDREMNDSVSVLVNNAGIDQPPSSDAGARRLEDIPLDESRRIFEVNTLGAFLVCQVFGSGMVRAGRGSIINIGSLYASVAPDPRMYSHIQQDPPFLKPPAYGASKAALVNLTRYLAALWGPHGVRVNALSPGGVLGDQDEKFKAKFSERVPLGRLAVEEDLVGPLLFLATDASSYVTGTELRVDGGYLAW